MVSPAASSTTIDAGFWSRCTAYLIDLVLLLVVLAVVTLVCGVPLGVFSEGNQTATTLLGALLAVGAAVGQWLYFALMESSAKQATLGKLVLGLHVVHGAEGQLTFKLASQRHLAKCLSAALLGSGFLMVAFTPRKQALHDLLIGTYVVKPY